MSLQQRWRALKFAVEDKKKELATLPPVTAIVNAIAAVRAALQPIFDAIVLLQKRWEVLGDNYNQFLAEETKEKWTWSKKNKQELVLLAAFPPYALGRRNSHLRFVLPSTTP